MGKVNRRSRSTIEGTGTNTKIPHKEQVLWHIEKMAGKTPGAFEYRKMISQYAETKRATLLL
ncbi:hypothetical protein [Herbaspirillum rhizosphaerae]|uniref:hypothetical protein n=1 Tax=Herbaspirillum rhizosphaerae TaxID=346179 RepID=UPI0012EE6972|nr:hypothetical protein [Herbaspirillum rhizosphaerae]